MNISPKIFSDPIIQWVFKNSGKGTYLVGGFLRDLLTGKESTDRDFAVKENAQKIAVMCADKFNGTYIELKEEHTYRVVISRHNVIDFSCLDGNIVNDLNKRDYTMNAMAWTPEGGIVDPCNGRSAILDKEVRKVNTQNLLDDPLRILRAYRLAAQTGFHIEANTRRYLEKYSRLVTASASERITDELFRLISMPNAMKYLKQCRDDDVLGHIIGKKTMEIEKNIHLIEGLELLIKKIRKKSDNELSGTGIRNYLKKDVSQGLNVPGLIRLALLLLNSSRQIRESDFGSLKPSNIVVKKTSCITDGCRAANDRITDRKLFEIYSRSKNTVYETAIGLSTIKKRGLKRFLAGAERFNRINSNCLLTGEDIKEILNIDQGKVIGEIKEDICRLHFLGKITKKEEARSWILSNLT